MFGVVVLVYGLLRSRKLLLLAGLIAFLAYFAVPRIQTRISGVTDPADSASYRLVSWQHTLEIIKDNILLGVGFNTYRYAQVEYGFIKSGDLGGNSGAGSDASLLLVFATTGIIGFSVFIFGMFYPIFNTSFSNSFILSVVLGLILESTFINSLFYPQILFIMVMIFAMSSVPEFKNYS
jgi:O-antigen ligase